jgi:hypothetical protein
VANPMEYSPLFCLTVTAMPARRNSGARDVTAK